MASTGKLEKMLILAFDTAEDAERGGTLEATALTPEWRERVSRQTRVRELASLLETLARR